MAAHFTYKHLPASGVGILDDRRRPYSTGGIGAAVLLRPDQAVSPDGLDSRPLLFPPRVFVGDYPVGISHIGPVSVVYSPALLATVTVGLPVMANLVAPLVPFVGTGELLDVVSMMLGVRQVLADSVGVAMGLFSFVGVETAPVFVLSVEDGAVGPVVSDTVVDLTVAVAFDADMMLGVASLFGANVAVDESFDANLSQTLDY